MLTPKRALKASSNIIILFFIAGLLVGSLMMFYVTYRQVNNLEAEISDLQTAISSLQGLQNTTHQEVTIIQNGISLTEMYSNVRDSVVLIRGETNTGSVQGSGFVYNYKGQNVILTNYHVIEDVISLSVTFSNGKGYSADVIGEDPYADLAVVQVNDADSSEFKPVTIVSSSSLSVGETVIAIGNPYGLIGSLTTGVVSATGRSITVDISGGYAIANVIQMSAPINPGNSGGILLNSLGNVVGITTAIVSDSQGVGFAIPSNTILREIDALVNTGSYDGHSYLGVTGMDMSYFLAQETDTNVTYGWKIATIVSNGPSDGKLVVGDIIIAMNNQTIKNGDDLASYLEEKTLPGNKIDLTIIRDNEERHVVVTLGTRPDPL